MQELTLEQAQTLWSASKVIRALLENEDFLDVLDDLDITCDEDALDLIEASLILQYSRRELNRDV